MAEPTVDDLCVVLECAIRDSDDPQAMIEQIRAILHDCSPVQAMPIDRVRWVPHEQVTPNDYNPNQVARMEMELLYHSIVQDGYTQPVVTIWDEEQQLYVIVDGFHRYWTMRTHPDIYRRCNGLLPVVVIEKSLGDRMAATVRHNRARGSHSVSGMSYMIFVMLDQGWDDEAICREMGMTQSELDRLKHITGFSKLLEDGMYRQAWMARHQGTEG